MTKGIKFDGEKPDYSLVPPYALDELAKLLTFGARKYAPNNWQKVKPKKRYYSAIGRHLTAYMKAVLTNNKEAQFDDESGVHHLICAACNCFFLFEHETVYSIEESFYGNTEETKKEEVKEETKPKVGLPKIKPEDIDSETLEKMRKAIEEFEKKQKAWPPLLPMPQWPQTPFSPSIPDPYSPDFPLYPRIWMSDQSYSVSYGTDGSGDPINKAIENIENATKGTL